MMSYFIALRHDINILCHIIKATIKRIGWFEPMYSLQLFKQ